MADKPPRILLIDDDPRDARWIREVLARGADAPVHLVSVDRLAAGLDCLTKGQTDVVLLDLSLPDSRGLDNLAAVRAQAPGVPVVVLGRFNEEGLARRAVYAGAQDYLIKEHRDGCLLIHALTYAIERQQAEEALRYQKSLLEAQSEASLDGILVVSPEGKILSFNERFVQMWGIPAEVLATRSDEAALQAVVAKLVQPQEFLDRVAALYQHPEEESHEEIALKDGRIFDRYSAPVKGPAGASYGRVWFFRDITAHRQLEEQFRQAQKMEAVGRFAGGVAHDFNNMLEVILGYSDLLLEQAGPDAHHREGLEAIKESAIRAAALTRQLLVFSRKQPLVLQALDLNQVVAHMEQMLRRLIREDVELSVVPGQALARVTADAGQMEQVLMNLAVNARDAMPQGGRLVIETASVYLDGSFAGQHLGVQPGPYVLLAVSDTGCGMDLSVQRHLFEPFFTTKEAGKGTGLGLATVYGIVKQSGGHIEVYSEPGRGTRFEIYLPSTEEAVPAAPLREPVASPRSGSETILLVEDEPLVRKLVRETLEMSGYRVLEAGRGDDALRICEQHQGPIDLLLTDVVMPGMSGPELAARVTGVRPEISLLFMSGHTDSGTVHHSIGEGGPLYLQKPFPPRALTHKVRTALEAN